MVKKTLPETKTDQATCAFGAQVLLKHLKALEKEIDGVREGDKDPEFIHRARVASRRLRATIPLFESCFPAKKVKTWQKRIRAVTRALGEARDSDVQRERVEEAISRVRRLSAKPGLVRLLLRLSQQRALLQPHIVSAMDDLVESGLVDEISGELQPIIEFNENETVPTHTLYRRSYTAIYARLTDFLSFEPIVFQPDKVTELHQMRIAAKWLRYTMETYAPLYSEQLKQPLNTIRGIQDQLGEIHDCDVWQEFLPRFLAEERQRVIDFTGSDRSYKRLVPGITYFARDRRTARDAMYAQFTQEWREWQDKEVWRNLEHTIQMPLLQPEGFYPQAPVAKEPG